MLDLQRHPHRRYNPLTGDWVLVSPQRTMRPWQGQVEAVEPESLPEHDPECYLCPDNPRAGGARNPSYRNTFVFDNDFPAMLSDAPVDKFELGRLLVAKSEPGICRVVCFSPRHNLTFSGMTVVDLRRVVDVWVEQYQELGSRSFINSVQIFENRGAMMGASNPHPHCQIWANATMPNEMTKELAALGDHYLSHQSCLICDYLALEAAAEERLVCQNREFAVVVPFWAVWPFETLLISKRHATGLDELNDAERDGLADILKRLTTRYDSLFKTVFAYSMGFHQRPTDGTPQAGYHLHAHFYPPLLRSASVRKFMVGYELLAMPQRDITAETAAGWLRQAEGEGCG